MLQVLSILLISSLVVPIAPVSAQDINHAPTLKERVRNMDAEVGRFLDLKTAHSGGLLLEQETSATDESAEAIRAKLLSFETRTRIGAILTDGERIQGGLVEVTDDAFCLSVESHAVEVNHRRYVRRHFDFEQVKELVPPGSPKKVHEVSVGKRVEVVLPNGEKVRGRVLDVTDQGFTLSLEGGVTRTFDFDEVTGVRKLGMLTSTKILIAAGIAAVALGLISYTSARAL